MMDGQRLSQGAVSKDQDDENSRPLKPHQPCNMHVRRDWLDKSIKLLDPNAARIFRPIIDWYIYSQRGFHSPLFAYLTYRTLR